MGVPVSVKVRAIEAEEHGTGSIATERRVSELNGRPVVEVQVRARPRWLRCATAPHAAEVSVLRPENRYHRLVFTVPEWDAFLVDVKAGLFDVIETP
jgi:hypothetical protein